MTGTLTGWQVDLNRSSADFAVRNLVVKVVRGRIPIREVVVDSDDDGRPVAVHAVLDVTGIDTGNRRRDRHLAEPRLLDTGQWPTLDFAGKIQPTEPDTYRVPGTVTAHGTAVDVVLDVQVTRDGDEVRARGTATLDRRTVGIHFPRLLIGYRIEVVVVGVLSPSNARILRSDDCATAVDAPRGTAVSRCHVQRPVQS